MSSIHFEKQIFLTSFIFLLLICSGCMNLFDNSTKNTEIKDTLRWGVLSTASIYPLDIINENYWTIIPNIFEGLVEFDKDFHIVPALAVFWNNPDSLTWRFYLREGVKFHNGEVFTAEDVKYSFETFHRSFGTIVDDILIINNMTVEFKTFEPNPGFLSRLAHTGIIYCTNTSGEQGLVGTGPYRLADYELDNYTTLERFDEYWGEQPTVKTVVFQTMDDEDQRLDALLSGAIDIAEYNIDDRIHDILSEENITVVKFPPLSTYIIGFDLRKNGSYGYLDGMNPTADVLVRKAIYQAINITPLINGPFHGFAYPESQFITPYIFGYNSEIERLPYNQSASRQLLEEAGYEHGFNITMDCITEGFEYNAENCYLITQQLAEVGIHVTMNNLSMEEYNHKVVVERNTSMYLVGWGTISTDGGAMYDYFIRTAGENLGVLNSGYYSNAEVDRLGAAAAQEMDPAARLQMLQEGFRIALVDDVMVVPLFSQELITLRRNTIELEPRADLRCIVKDIRIL